MKTMTRRTVLAGTSAVATAAAAVPVVAMAPVPQGTSECPVVVLHRQMEELSAKQVEYDLLSNDAFNAGNEIEMQRLYAISNEYGAKWEEAFEELIAATPATLAGWSIQMDWLRNKVECTAAWLKGQEDAVTLALRLSAFLKGAAEVDRLKLEV